MNLYARLAAGFPRSKNAPCVILPDERVWTYGDLEHASARMAHALLKTGALPGDRVAVQVDKSPEAFVLYLACLRAGLVFLPLNPAYQGQEVAYFLGDAKPALFVCRPSFFSAAQTLFDRRRIFTLDEHGRGSLIKAAAGESDTFATVERAADDLAAILYTSGTTGRSKGAMLTHQNLWANAETLTKVWRINARDVLLHMLPIFHVHGLFVAGHCILRAGAKMFFEPRFDLQRALKRLPESSVLMGVPTFYTRLLAAPQFTARVCEHMRLFISGSAPLLAETFAEFKARTGHTILERYGMTEGGMFTSNPYAGRRRGGSVGPPLPGVALRIVDDADVPCAPCTPGHIQVKGENVFAGYWNMPEKTAEEFTADGYFRTGDIGYQDNDGYVFINGRARDMIISGGLNVYPREIEEIIDALPDVVESAVVGLPHADLGETVVAVVVRKKGSTLDEDSIIAAVRCVLAAFKSPRRVIFRDDLPRNAMGKVVKSRLRETLAKT